MTFNTNRNNIKPMFFGVAFVVVVLFCLFRAIMAFQGIGARQLAIPYSIIDSVSSLIAIGIFCLATLCSKFAYKFTSFALIITSVFSLSVFAMVVFPDGSFVNNLPFLALAIRFLILFFAYFALVAMFIFFAFIFVKFRNGFNFFAIATSFCYDLLRHSFFLTKKLCSGPVLGYIPISGSFHYKGTSL